MVEAFLSVIIFVVSILTLLGKLFKYGFPVYLIINTDYVTFGVSLLIICIIVSMSAIIEGILFFSTYILTRIFSHPIVCGVIVLIAYMALASCIAYHAAPEKIATITSAYVAIWLLADRMAVIMNNLYKQSQE